MTSAALFSSKPSIEKAYSPTAGLITLTFSTVAIVFLLPVLAGLPVGLGVLAGACFLLSHVMRALRLAVLSMDMLGISGRTAMLAHFATAPIALALPFKTGEVLRLYELSRLGGSLIYAAIVLFVDRMFDTLFLIPLVAFLLWQGSAAPVLVALTALAAFVPLIVITVGPRILTEAQRHVVATHNGRGALNTLKTIDAIRNIVHHAARVSRQQAATLALLSALVWLLEFIVCALLVSVLAGAQFDPFVLLGDRLTTDWWSAAQEPVVLSSIILTVIALLAIWPLVTAFYAVRRAHALTKRTDTSRRAQP
ncbi:MAG: lysylphosphatidylglycerol synthase domain-containing protein [Pseudomonadota bacterium]